MQAGTGTVQMHFSSAVNLSFGLSPFRTTSNRYGVPSINLPFGMTCMNGQRIRILPNVLSLHSRAALAYLGSALWVM